MQYFDIIFFAIVAGILGIRLFRVLGRKTDSSLNRKQNPEPAPEIKGEKNQNNFHTDVEGSLLNGEGIDFLKKVDSSFDKKSFLSGAQSAFEMIITAFNTDNKKTLRKFLDDDVYRAFETVMLDRDKKGHYVENPIKLSVEKCDIENVNVKEGIAFVKVVFVSSQQVVVKDSETDEIISQSDPSKEKIDKWEFCRELSSQDPNWKLVHTESG